MLCLKTTVMSMNFMRYCIWYFKLFQGMKNLGVGEQRIGWPRVSEGL